MPEQSKTGSSPRAELQKAGATNSFITLMRVAKIGVPEQKVKYR
jgi:hypothetical protein